jgi:tetratricopeptide (TPR) repeat protein
MKIRFHHVRPLAILLAILLPVNICLAQTAKPAPAEDKAALRAKAMEFTDKGRYIDAYPLFEKIAPLYPDDAELWAHYGIALMTRSSTLSNAAERKTERIKGYKALAKAKQLGTENSFALDVFDRLSPDGEIDDALETAHPEFEKNIREGEAFFGSGQYDKAFAAYERASKIDPKSYEAVLYMGDSLYAAGKYKESEPWFARAALLDPDRDEAYRYWGDALMFQKKSAEACDKFVEALLASPYTRTSWTNLAKWMEDSGAKTVPLVVIPPGNEVLSEIVIDAKLLKSDDGTIHWKKYDEARASQLIAGGRAARKLVDEAAAFRRVADAVRADLKSGAIKYPDKDLVNLIKLDDAGLLEAYVLLTRADEKIADEYLAYRKANKEKLRRFILEFMVGI